MRTVVYNIGELVTSDGPDFLRQGKSMAENPILKNGFFLFEEGVFTKVGSDYNPIIHGEADCKVDAKNRLVTPGFIDSHTHLVHAGSRAYELEQKLKGKSYLDILRQGGGILHTVRKTRSASFPELYEKAYATLLRMMQFGVVAVEAKSGYGLEEETEYRQLKVAKALGDAMPIEIISTFMGAHAIPEEYQSKKPEYIDLVKAMLDTVKQENLAEFCDVFCESGVFEIDESEEILQYAKALGLKLKIHADEIVSLGGASLAAKLGCRSADHLMAAKEADLKELAASNVAATILPMTSFYLDQPFANARMMIENNCGIAIATDYNPGSCPSENIQLAMQMALLKQKMTPKEIITAVTANAAYALGFENRKGSIAIGKEADFIIFDCPDLDHFFYRFGVNQVCDVYSKGKKIIENQKYRSEYEIN